MLTKLGNEIETMWRGTFGVAFRC